MRKKTGKNNRHTSNLDDVRIDPFDLDLDLLLIRLIRLRQDQKDAIREAFTFQHRRKEEPERLLEDWVRIVETGHQLALTKHEHGKWGTLLSSPSVRKRRDRQLRQTAAAVNRAIAALDEYVGLLGKHARDFTSLQAWVNRVNAELLRQHSHVERYRREAAIWPSVRAKLGAPKPPKSYVLEVLAAYFRQKGWPVSGLPTGLFAEVAYLVLDTGSLNYDLLHSLAASRLDYTTLEAEAPKGVRPGYPQEVLNYWLNAPRTSPPTIPRRILEELMKGSKPTT